MRLRLLLLAVACTVLCAVVYLLAFDSARGEVFDRAVFAAATAQNGAPRVRVASRAVIDTVDVASLALLGGGIVAVALVRRRLDVAVAAAALLVGANVTAQLLKPWLHGLDPFSTEPGRVLRASFPSGHSTVAMSIALALVLAAPAAVKLPAALLGAAYAWAMGFSLLVQGAHYASDVAGGFLVAGAWAGLVAAFALPRPTGAAAARAGLAVAGVLVLAFAGAVAAVALTRPEAIAWRIQVQTRLVFAVICLAVLAVAVAAGLASLLQARRPST